ncbi:hypothetical protein [Chryseobacterium indologenes]|uniref:Tetratricopeptide repeat protein n=1 Tax=Chryseobacterium indologenes TaxID=253 RepID=A0A0N0ZTX1_CHRID|nr:hypothetical protein [Chryseobacterium indologenes]KPE50566.1 hypothetical protein AOB46_14395 [Chryseobacterium indologenes]
MKKYLLSFAFAFMSLTSFAQSDYEKVMTEKISRIEACRTAEDFQALANDFARINAKETKEWLPGYYAAFASIQKGRVLMREGKMKELDAAAAEAEKYLAGATGVLRGDNAETHLLRKMAFSLRMMVNPQQRYKTAGASAEAEMKAAEKMDPENPRIALIKAEDVYFMPKQYGGSKTKGIAMFKEALAKFNTYTPKSALDPNWGKAEAEYFISQPVK